MWHISPAAKTNASYLSPDGVSWYIQQSTSNEVAGPPLKFKSILKIQSIKCKGQKERERERGYPLVKVADLKCFLTFEEVKNFNTLCHGEYSTSKAIQVLILTVNDATCILQWTFQMVIYDSNCARDDNVVVYFFFFFPSKNAGSIWLDLQFRRSMYNLCQANANWNLILWVLFIVSVKSKILTPWEIMEVGTYPHFFFFFLTLFLLNSI